MEKILIQAIQKALTSFGLPKVEVELEHPADESFGDWSTSVALQYIKQTEEFSNSKEFAQEIKKKLVKILVSNSNVESISTAGYGFINFKLSQNYWLKKLNWLANDKNQIISTFKRNLNKKIIVEYSSPNIAKPFTVGHLRSTIIGDAIANLYEILGWQVYRDNHLGDWGTQFGKLIYAIKTWGNKEDIAKSERPIKELVNLYIKFHQEAKEDPSIEDQGRAWFKKLETGDKEARELWQWCVDLSWQEFDVIYSQLGTKFTENNARGYGESYFEKMMPDILALLEKQLPKSKEKENGGYYGEGEDGAKLVFFSDERLPSLMIVKKDGATLYSTRDLATDYFRLKKYDHPDLIVNEVGAEQSLYFRQIFRIEEMLGWYKPGQRVHVKHGLYRFKEGKMSTREGNVIWLEDVIEEAEKRAMNLSKHTLKLEQFEGISQSIDQTRAIKPGHLISNHSIIGIGALKWNDLKSESSRDIMFNWDQILNMKGNSGPYVQYAVVRAKSVLKKANQKIKFINTYTFNKEEQSVIIWLNRFNETIEKSAMEFAPHHLALFLFELAQRFNAFYNQHSILDAKSSDSVQIRLALTQSTHATLSQGLKLLGIDTPEEM